MPGSVVAPKSAPVCGGVVSVNTEKIIKDAEVAAVYLRALVDRGVPMAAATQLTSSYVAARQFNDAQKGEPKPPWEA
jgi:hypothetical protein